MNKRNALGVALALLLYLAAATPLARAADDDPAKLAPMDAMAFLGINDVDAAWADLQKTAGYRMMNDPAGKSMKQLTFLSKVLERAKTAIGKALDTPPDKLENPFGGSAALYLVAPADGEKEPGAVLTIGIDNKERMSGYFKTALGKLRDAADDYEQIDFSGFEIHQFKTEPKEKANKKKKDQSGLDPNSDPFSMDEQAMDKMVEHMFGELFSGENLPPRFAMCIADDRFYVAQTADLIRNAIRSGRGDESLADHDDYKLMIRRFDPVGRVRVLINTPRIIEIATRDDDEARKIVKVLGLDGVGCLVAHASFGDSEDYESRTDALLVLKGERSGLAKIFSMDNGPITPPKSISDENAIYFSLNVNPSDVVDEVQRMVRQESPDEAEKMAQSLGDVPTPDGNTLNIRKDVIDNLRPPLRLLVGFGKPYGPDNVHFVASIGHRDKKAMERVLSMVTQMSPMPLNDREVNGNRMWEMQMGGLALGAANDAVVIGTGRTVEALLRGDDSGTSLADAAPFRRAAAQLPDDASGVIFADSRRLFEGALALAKQRDQITANAMVNPAAMIALQMAEGMTATIKDDQLDQAHQLLKYQTAGLLTVRTTSDGILLSQVTLHPAGE